MPGNARLQHHGLCGKPVAGSKKVAADQQHGLRPVKVQDFWHAFHRHPASGARHGALEWLPQPPRLVRDGLAGLRAVAEAPAMMGKNSHIRSEQAEQLAKQQGWCNSRSAAHGRMREERHAGKVAHEPVEIGKSEDHRFNHHRLNALLHREPDLRGRQVQVARDVRHIGRQKAGIVARMAHRAGAGPHPLGEAAIGLVGKPVIVLDEVDTARRELTRDRPKLRRRQPLRLHGGASERAISSAANFAQARYAIIWPAEVHGHHFRELGVVQCHILLQARIAEQHVEKLARIAARAGRGKPDAHLENTWPKLAHTLHLARNVTQHRLAENRLPRQPGALLQRNRLCARLDGGRVALHPVNRNHALHAFTLSRYKVLAS